MQDICWIKREGFKMKHTWYPSFTFTTTIGTFLYADQFNCFFVTGFTSTTLYDKPAKSKKARTFLQKGHLWSHKFIKIYVEKMKNGIKSVLIRLILKQCQLQVAGILGGHNLIKIFQNNQMLVLFCFLNQIYLLCNEFYRRRLREQ